jgi:hypothetical protein
VAQKQLNMFQSASGLVAQPRAYLSQIVTKGRSFTVCLSSFREMFVYALPVGMLEKSGHLPKRFCALILEVFV